MRGQVAKLYRAITRSLGFGLLAGSIVLGVLQSFALKDLLLVGLAIPAGWLRFRLEPSGHITLIPVVFFLGMILSPPYVPIVAVTSAAFVSSKVFARQPWLRAVGEVGEEGVAALISVLIYAVLIRSSGTLNLNIVAGILLAEVVYLIATFLLGALKSKVEEGASLRGFALGAGKNLVTNTLVFAVSSLAMAYIAVTFQDIGYFILALGTIALIEFYHPWRLLSEQGEVLQASLAMVAQAIDVKDPYTARHSRNVRDLAVRIARKMGLPETEVRRVGIGALMHDIGKVGVSGRIIRKPGKLGPEEAQKMRQHAVMSADIMNPVELLAEAAESVRHHHEYFDGSGYPTGLVGEDIPLGSRVILVADAFDAMTTDRPYRKGRSRSEALGVLQEHSGRQFDPKVVAALVSIIQQVGI